MGYSGIPTNELHRCAAIKVPSNISNKNFLHERLLTTILYQIKLGELVSKAYWVLCSHHLPLLWGEWGKSQEISFRLSCFTKTERPNRVALVLAD